MTKIKTSELTGAALDWAVAKAEGATDFWFDTIATHWIKLHGKDRALRSGWAQSYLPSTDWSQGGPIIEREGITTRRFSILEDAIKWGAYEMPSIRKPKPNCVYGPTPLIAAMRCYVASKLGEDVSIPEELIK